VTQVRWWHNKSRTTGGNWVFTRKGCALNEKGEERRGGSERRKRCLGLSNRELHRKTTTNPWKEKRLNTKRQKKEIRGKQSCEGGNQKVSEIPWTKERGGKWEKPERR